MICNPKHILVQYKLICLLLLTDDPISAQSVKVTSVEEQKKQIEWANDRYCDALCNNDSVLFTDQYMEDCWIMLPNAPALCGPDAAGNFFQVAYHVIGARNCKFILADIACLTDELIATSGFSKFYNDRNQEVYNGKFLVLWKKTLKGWKRWREIFNSNQ